MSSLRCLANDIQSQRQSKNQYGFNTQKHTANKPSLVETNNVENSQKTVKGGLPPGGSNIHKRNPSQLNNPAANQKGVASYDAYDEFSSQKNCTAGPTRIQTLGHVSNDDNGAQKLEPILEEHYL